MMIVYNLPAHRRPPCFSDRPAHRPTAAPFPTAREHPYRDIRMLLIISMTMTMIRSGTIRSQ